MSPGLRQQRLPAPLRRSQLLDVALELFAERGFHETSMEEIAERAGVTKPVLYQHFPSKRQLYLELLDTVGKEMLTAVESGATSATSPRQRVHAGFRAYFQFVSDRRNAFRLLFGSGARQPDDSADVVRALEDAVARTIGGFIEASVDDEHRAVLGYAIVGMAEVAARRWAVASELDGAGLEPVEGERLAQRLADLAWAGLRGLPAE